MRAPRSRKPKLSSKVASEGIAELSPRRGVTKNNLHNDPTTPWVETRRASGSVNPSDCLPSHISSTVAAWTISGQVPVDWQRGWTAGVRSEFAEMPRYLTTGKRVAYIRLRPVFVSWGNGARTLFETARCQRDIRGDAYVGGRDVLCNPVAGRICAFAHQNHSHVGSARRPDRSRAVGDSENMELQASRHAIDLLAHRARITIDVDFSQLPVRCLSTLAIPGASTTASALAHP
jgi:hypothetical protein